MPAENYQNKKKNNPPRTHTHSDAVYNMLFNKHKNNQKLQKTKKNP